MFPRLLAAGVALLGLQGCVAAIPLVAQLATGATSVSQLCAAARIPGQSASLCDKLSLGASQAFQSQTSGKSSDDGKKGAIRTGMADPVTTRATVVR